MNNLKEDKELLLKDLCARLPYGVKYSCDDIKNVWRLKTIFTRSDNSIFCDGCNALELCKPYLFPLSSMTEEQYNSLHELGILDNCSHSYEYANPHIHGVSFIFKQFKTYSLELIEWLNKNHFDYRGLIEKGLAVNATGLNIY